MVFSSLVFLFRFIPIFFILYFFVPKKWTNIVVLLGSLVFYAYGEPIYVFIMLASIAVNHLLALGINRKREYGRLFLAVALILDFGILFFFKYLSFCINNINLLLGKEYLSALNLTLPLGISFYTFQIASYMIDAYRGKIKIEKNPIYFATYVCMFPQLIAGPIVNYSEVVNELHHRKTGRKDIEYGISMFIVGLSFKVLLANNIQSLWNDVERVGIYGINTLGAWLGSIGFSMQLYFDFYGYSLMAIGLGALMGFAIPENFDSPYMSLSATEFWRRWHITLGRWFREYIYIPLGGSRQGKKRFILASFTVWFVTGVWHGAEWNFIIWGLFFFAVLMIEKAGLKKILDKIPALGHIYMFILIPVSWTIFKNTDLKELGLYLRRMFAIPIEGSLISQAGEKTIQLIISYWWLIIICAICATPYPFKYVKKYYDRIWCKIVLLILFWTSVYMLANGVDNPFLYFRF